MIYIVYNINRDVIACCDNIEKAVEIWEDHHDYCDFHGNEFSIRCDYIMNTGGIQMFKLNKYTYA